jgi:ribonuclease R
MARAKRPDSPTEAVNASAVLTAIEAADEALSWQQLKARFSDHRRLRLVLKGLERNGELERDHKGRYHRTGEGDLEGILTGRGNRLMLDGIPVQPGHQLVLRSGDKVRGRHVGDTAQILEVLTPSPELVVGLLNTSRRYPFVEALSADYSGRVSLTDPLVDAVDGDTVKVRIIANERRGLVGTIVEVVDGATVLEKAATTMLEAYSVPRIWPEGMDEVVAKLPRNVVPGDHRKRVDYTDCALITIDGETARDFDDAVFAEPDGDGFRLVVAIADVAHYVKPGSVLDAQAQIRGNSVYLPDRVVPMLPEALSNDLCSLRPDEPRLAMVCEMRISGSGQLQTYSFAEGLIQSQRRATYTQVGDYLEKRQASEDLGFTPAVRASLENLHKLYKVLLRARVERGGLDFDSHEAILEFADGRVSAIHPSHRNDAHRLIEEAMILANVAAASYLEDHDRLGMYRVHEGPEGEKLDTLASAFALAGIRWQKGEVTPKKLQSALATLENDDRRWLYETLVLRSLKQAVYTPENKGHFGLALDRYMHFTSPIRRYSDLLVHRAIKAVLHNRGDIASMEDMVALGVQISSTERRAEEVGWAVDAWLKADFLKDRVGEEFDGVVASVTDFGLFVELTGIYVQGLLHISELGRDYYNFQPAAMSLVGERSGQVYTLGQAVKVRLTGVRPAQGKLDLELVGGSSKARRSRDTSGSRGGNRGPKKGRR